MQRLPLPGYKSLAQPSPSNPPSNDLPLKDMLERWAGSDETLRMVMIAKAEEDKLKQDVMRLEIRRTEMEMLKEALRAGIPPHLVPQIFGNNTAQSLTSAMRTPSSPTNAIPTVNRIATSAPYPPFRTAKREASATHADRVVPPMTSPRQLPKIETGLPQAPFPSSTAAISDSRDVPVQANESATMSVTAGSETNPSSLFFHHWQPPSQSYNSPAAAESVPRTSENPGSPTPRRKRLLSGSLASRHSPVRGHSRHRSEASTLSGRLPEVYQPMTSRHSEDGRPPSPRLTSYELDSARKRKREEGFDVLAHARQQSLATPATIREESRVVS